MKTNRNFGCASFCIISDIAEKIHRFMQNSANLFLPALFFRRLFKKLQSDVSADEKIISEKEYMKLSGLASYKKRFALSLKIRVTQEEKDFIAYERAHNVNYAVLMQL